MERSVNRVELKGRVGQDAKILKVENGGTAAMFTLATNEIIKVTTLKNNISTPN